MRIDKGEQARLDGCLRAGDPTAPARVFEVLLDPLIGSLKKTWPDHAQDEMVRDAAVDSIANYTSRPERFDPSRSTLLSYLVMDASGDLINEYEKSKRRNKLIVLVEEPEDRRNTQVDDYPSDRVPPDITFNDVREAFPNDRDREAVFLMIKGETSNDAFARVWNVNGDTAKQRAADVKRNKDRIKARIRRMRKPNE